MSSLKNYFSSSCAEHIKFSINDTPSFKNMKLNKCICSHSKNNFFSIHNDVATPTPQQIPFTTEWNVNEGETIMLPLLASGNYDFFVNWGDGSIPQRVESYGEISHTFSKSGIYVITIKGKCIGWNFTSSAYGGSKDKLMSIREWGSINLLDFNSAFKDCSSLKTITSSSPLQFPDDTNLDMSFMFSECSLLSNINGLSNWSFSQVTYLYMNSMFLNCSSLSNINPLSNWSFPDVTNLDMQYMFVNCSSLSDINPLSNWSFPKVIILYIGSMFYNCSSLSNINGLSNWSFPQVTTFDMNTMFRDCISLSNINPLSNWSFPKVTILDMSLMFYNCSSLSDASSLEVWGMNTATTWVTNNMFDLTQVCSMMNQPSWYTCPP